MRKGRANDLLLKKSLEARVQELEKAASQAERDENARYSPFVGSAGLDGEIPTDHPKRGGGC